MSKNNINTILIVLNKIDCNHTKKKFNHSTLWIVINNLFHSKIK